MSPQQTVQLMLQALVQAIDQRQLPPGLTHHSNLGSHYTAYGFREFCDAARIKQSMGSVGDCYDNAMTETFFASLQKELINRQPGNQFGTRAEAKVKIFQYTEVFIIKDYCIQLSIVARRQNLNAPMTKRTERRYDSG